MPEMDWKVKVGDWLKIIVMVVMIIAAYYRMDQRITATEIASQENSKSLQEHIRQQNEITNKALEVLTKMGYTLQQFPPHRHTKHGEILYPNSPPEKSNPE